MSFFYFYDSLFSFRRICHRAIYFFFFYCYAVLRDLHSFPTRRSSDLFIPFSWVTFSLPVSGPPETTPAKNLSRSIRSEEHTSELQSRQYLVCRLLLEKKKN